jgi:asparagine synthase (glutamine-hydrolysing)
MPGIGGILSSAPLENGRDLLAAMVRSLHHGTEVSTGLFACGSLNVYMGWLSRQGAFNDCLPIYNAARNKVLFLSGEVFFDDRTRKKIDEGGPVYSSADGSGLMYLYEEWGERMFPLLNGTFGGVLLDQCQKRLFLFNDRYGSERIFFHENSRGFYFSSEAKALLAILPDLREWDAEGLGQFLTSGCTLGERSLFKNIRILPAASLWEFRGGKAVGRKHYFHWPSGPGPEGPENKEHREKLIAALELAVQRQTEGKLPFGVSLTGGLDSRMIMACLKKAGREFPCYTFASMYRESFDVRIARQVAYRSGQRFVALTLDEDFLNQFLDYLGRAVYISDGYMGLAGAAELYLNHLAAGIAPVRLTGNYGDEVLRSFQAFKPLLPRGGFVHRDVVPFLEKAVGDVQGIQATDPLTFVLSHQIPYQDVGRRTIERSEVALRTPFLDNELVDLIFQTPRNILDNDGLSIALIEKGGGGLLEIPSDRGHLKKKSKIQTWGRRLYCEALFKGEYWSSHGMPDWISSLGRGRLKTIMEKTFLGHFKFHHFLLWSRGRLQGPIREVIDQGTKELKEIVNKEPVEKILADHFAGKRNYLREIDQLLTLSVIQQRLLKM